MPVEEFEDGLGPALHRAADTFTPGDRPALVEDGIRRGRRRMVRRRAAVTGSVLALALIGSAGACASGLFADGTRTGRTASVAAPPKPDTRPGKVSGQQMVALLKNLLPKGTFSEEEGRGTDAATGPLAYAVYDDGRGKSAISLSLSRTALPGSSPAGDERVTCPDRALSRYDACTSEKVGGGAQLRILQGYEYPDRREDTKDWTATLLTPGGYLVEASEWNAAAEKGAEVSRKLPPLSPAQLRKLVTAQAWRPALKALPAPQKEQPTAEARRAEVSSKKIRALLTSLLPDGVRVAAEGGQGTEWAWMTLDDKRGRTFLEINVQSLMTDVAEDLARRAQHVGTLADGTEVMTSQGPAEKGGAGVVQWTADTIRPDGYRVVLLEMNTGSLQGGSVTRSTPVITMKQLRAVASSDKWLALRPGA
ncbi:hypothetical protein [Streptomyces sp. NBC_00344]|uniref:hypothetical protein n=1 Tax=Streptomyces sp. NBC_00344 TaxID=2975720 RepID=UPI002E1DBF64